MSSCCWTASVLSHDIRYYTVQASISNVIWKHTWTAPSRTTDRFSPVRLLMGKKPDSGTADLGAAVAWPNTETTGRLGIELADSLLVRQCCNTCFFKLGHCFVTQSSPGWAVACCTGQGHWVNVTLLQVERRDIQTNICRNSRKESLMLSGMPPKKWIEKSRVS